MPLSLTTCTKPGVIVREPTTLPRYKIRKPRTLDFQYYACDDGEDYRTTAGAQNQSVHERYLKKATTVPEEWKQQLADGYTNYGRIVRNVESGISIAPPVRTKFPSLAPVAEAAPARSSSEPSLKPERRASGSCSALSATQPDPSALSATKPEATSTLSAMAPEPSTLSAMRPDAGSVLSASRPDASTLSASRPVVVRSASQPSGRPERVAKDRALRKMMSAIRAAEKPPASDVSSGVKANRLFAKEIQRIQRLDHVATIKNDGPTYESGSIFLSDFVNHGDKYASGSSNKTHNLKKNSYSEFTEACVKQKALLEGAKA
eukprot:gnl/TRDRNA2_/TRDRNA2_46174_c0_seq2.p1 gnl/TRDRNA2_/TRDRNA2_46174_c0~~gnl/TRDRNA2_/TRDRNA2_46174_c0_seq2.p1  ORF type:complete len:337 (+),score=57.39 gnl/TRDRNA2_/TRDRNA2_46174_c0_seq2:57-1013(+)